MTVGYSDRVQGRRAAVAAWARRQDLFDTDSVMQAFGLRRDNAAKILSRLVRDGLIARAGNYEFRAVKR
jgi:hypothetical protein